MIPSSTGGGDPMVVSYEEIIDLIMEMQARDSALGLPGFIKPLYYTRLNELKLAIALEANCGLDDIGLLPEDTMFFSSGVRVAFKNFEDLMDAELQRVEKTAL